MERNPRNFFQFGIRDFDDLLAMFDVDGFGDIDPDDGIVNNIRRIGWRNRPRRRVVYTQDQVQLALELRRSQFTYRQIARRIGPFCSPGTIHQWVRQAEARSAK